MVDWLQLELTRPEFLFGLVALPLLFYYFRRSLSDLPRWQRIVSLGARSVFVLLLVLSLAGFTWLRPTSDQYVIFAIDQSLSVGDESADAADQYLDEALKSKQSNRVAFLPFSREPDNVTTARPQPPASDAATSPSSETEPAPALPSPATSTANQDSHGTDIAAAIEAASGSIPPGYIPHIVLISDGNQTHGDALRASLQAEIPISTVPLATRSDPEVQVSSVKVPAQVREGEPFFVEVVIDCNHESDAVIKVYRGAYQVVSERKKLDKGENQFRFQQTITGERLANFTVRVESPEDTLMDDTLVDNNADFGLVYASGKPRVLIIESDPRLIRQLVYALEQQDIHVDVRPPTGMPESLADLQNYELLILSNVPATDLTQRQMEIARAYTQDLGGGFMMLGGDQSFGLGGYYKSVLEELLPVRSDFEKEKEKPSLGMVLVIDKSGSMSGDKVEMAKSAARSAVELLGSRDKIGVIAFDGETFVMSEMQPAGNKGRISDDISRIDASGGTVMYPAMEQAYDMLRETSARLKHVIILTDGVSSPGDFQGLAQTMTSERITVSTVAVGSDSDTDLLEEIARMGNGRYYFTDDPAAVPQIFAKETVTASKSAIDEQPFIPQVIRATQAFQDLDFDTAPFLLGYVMTRPKPTSEVILATERGDPLLSWWRYGLGMTVAFTSDAKSRWAAEWLTWPGFGKFWAQLIRHTMRRDDVRGVQVQIDQSSGKATVTVDSIDPAGRFLDQAETELVVINPRLATSKIQLAQIAPGRYFAQFDTPESGAYHLELTQKQDGNVLYRQSRGLAVGYSDELRLRLTDDELLKSIAEVSKGRYSPAPAECFTPRGEIAHRPTPLWPWLVTAAALLLVLDVALRRIDFSTWLVSRRRAEARAGFAGP